MRFQIVGANRHTGEDVITTIDADDKFHAERIAREEGVLVSDVKPASPMVVGYRSLVRHAMPVQPDASGGGLRPWLIAGVILLLIGVGLVAVFVGTAMSDRADARRAARRAALEQQLDAAVDSQMSAEFLVEEAEAELRSLESAVPEDRVWQAEFDALSEQERKTLKGRALWQRVHEKKLQAAKDRIAELRAAKDACTRESQRIGQELSTMR
jgi:hypothetical protein